MNRRRQLKSGASYHVICKINRDEIIFDDDVITVLLLDIIIRCRKKHSFRVRNFCIMGNHIHFILTPGKDSSLPRIMQWINSVFAKAYNRKMGISGRLWKERYFSRIIETVKQFVTTFEYIVKNPIEAKLVQYAKNFKHSGLYHYLNKLKGIIDTDSIMIQKLYEHCKTFHR